MKKILIIAALLAASTTANATLKDKEAYCLMVAGSGEFAMAMRQYPEDIAKVKQVTEDGYMKDCKGDTTCTEIPIDFIVDALLSAFTQPRMSTEHNRIEAIHNFKNEAYMSCMTHAM